MNSSEKEQSPVHTLLEILFRRGWYVLVCVAAILLPVMYYNAAAPRIYQATTTIIYENPRPPISTVEQPYRFPVKESLLNQIQEINSRSVALEVAKALPDWAKSNFTLPENRGPQFDETAYLAAIIKNNIESAPVSESDVIQIKVRAKNDPYMAMTIANALCDVLQERNLRIRREGVSDMRVFIEEQRESYKKNLDVAEDALRRFKVANRVTSLDKEVEEELQLAKNIELLYQQAKNERERTEQYFQSIGEQINTQQAKLAPSLANVSSQIVQQLKTQLTDLQDDYIKLQLQGVPDNNSKMLQMKDDMERVRVTLAEEARRFAENEHMIDPVSQMSSLYQQQIELDLKLQMLRTQEKSLASSLAEYEQSLRHLPEKEFELARLTRERDLANNLYIMLSEKREEARISEAENVGNMRILDRAQLPKRPILPRKELNLAIGLMLGLTVGLGLAFFMESLDTTLKTPEEVERKTGLTILGSIPKIKNLSSVDEEMNGGRGNPQVLVTHSEPSSPASEAYRTLRTNLQFSNLAQKTRAIMLTSSGPREGKSTTSANLAVATAQMGLQTLLIDADLRRPTLHKIFNINREPGLADILLHHNDSLPGDNGRNGDENDLDNDLDDQHPLRHTSLRARKAVQQMVSLDHSLAAAVHHSQIEHLDVLTCGLLPHNPSEILSSETMRDLLALAKQKYEFVIIDAPPIIAVTDAAVLAPQMDAALMVVESARNDRDIILKAKVLLERVGVTMIGAVLNNVRERNLYGDYDYYYTYYSEKERKRNTKYKKSSY